MFSMLGRKVLNQVKGVVINQGSQMEQEGNELINIDEVVCLSSEVGHLLLRHKGKKKWLV